MPEKGEELYKILKADPNYEGVGSDYNKFKEFFSNEKNYTNLYNTLKADPNYEGIGSDANAFSEYFGLKKKDQQIPYGGQAFGGKEEKPLLPLTSSTVSPSVSKPPKSTTPSVSTGKLPGLEVQVEKPVSTQAVDNKDLALTVESREQRKKFLGEVNTGILESINKQPDLYMSQKDMPTMYGEKIIPAGTPNVDNIAKAVDLYAEKIKKETGRELTSFDKQYVVQSTLSSLKVKKQTQNAAMLTDLEFQKQKKLPLTAITGIKNAKGEVVKENMFQENVKQTVAQEQQRLEQIAKTPNKEINAEFKPEIEGLSAQVKGTADALNKEMKDSFTAQFTQQQNEIYNQYNQLVQTGQMPADAANAEMKQKIEAIGKQLENDTNALYAPKFNQLKQEAEEKSKEIQTRYNRKVQAQFNLEKEKANKRIQEEVSKYSVGLPKGYLEEYQAAFQKNFESQMKLDGLKKTTDFANLGNFEKMQTAIMAGWGDVAGTVGGSLSYVGINTGELQNWVAQSGLYNELPVFSGESIWDNVTNTDWWIANGVRSIPFTIATMPIGIAGGAGAGMLAKALGATRRAEMIASVVGGGIIGWDAEKFLEQGSAFNDAINEGKTASEAAQIATAVGKYNYATIPLNIAQMLPVFGNAFKFLGSAAIEAGSGYLEETAQGWAQAKAKAQSEGQDVAYLDYMTSPQAIEEGIIGAGMSQGFTLFSLNNTPDIDKQINALMTSLGTGGENQASFMLEVMKNNGAIDNKQYEQAKALLNYTLNGINQAQSINVEDDVKAALVNKFVAIEKAKELLTDNENDLASQAAKELIAEKEKEIKDILKGSEPVYFIKIRGNDIPVISTKEQVDDILSNPNMLPLFELQAHNDVKTQASIDEAYSKQKENAIQEPGTGEVLQRQPQEAGVTGSKRTGVEQSQQGQEVAKESSQKEVAPKTKELESLVNQIPVEDLRRPNGSIGTQGFTEENMIDVARFISREMGFDIPAFDSSLGTSEIKQLIDYLRGNKEAQQKIKEYVIKDPVVVSQMPDGSYSIADGNHRANLLNLIGVDVIPTIELNGRTNEAAIEEHKKEVEAILGGKQKDETPTEVATPETIETGRQEVSAVKKGKIKTANPIRLFKGLFGKRNPDGTRKTAHPGTKGVFSAIDEKTAERYVGEDGMGTFDIPAGTTIEVIHLPNRNTAMSKFRQEEVDAINASDAQIVKLITTDAKGAEEQYIIKDPALIEKMQKPEEAKKEKQKFTENVLKIAEETGLSPQEVKRTYDKYEGAKNIEDITTEDYLAARITGDKVKMGKAFDALLQAEKAKESVSPTVKKNAEKTMKEADKAALKQAAEIMEHIDKIQAQLQEEGVIEAVHCKWGK